MDYIVFDLEWNQCASEADMVTTPICLNGEIIEIGAVKLNDRFEKADELRLFIRPVYYKKMHRQIASLTGIHDRDLAARGIPFPEAYAAFSAWCGSEYSYMTWSTSDLPILLENMMLHGIDTSDLPDTYDLQRMFGREIMRCDRRISLDEALRILGEHGDIAHDALNDARNTVLVCNHLDIAEYADEYVSKPFAQDPITQDYPDAAGAAADPALAVFRCPWCGEEVTCESWMHWENNVLGGTGACTEGDEFLMTVTLNRIGSKKVRPFRLLYEMSDDLWELYQNRKGS